jgi:hypothetical protein
MKRASIKILVAIAITAACFLIYCRFVRVNRAGGVVRISEATALGEQISIALTIYEPPLHVTGDKISGATNEDWLAVKSKLHGSSILTFDQWKALMTPEFLKEMPMSEDLLFQRVQSTNRAMFARLADPTTPREVLRTFQQSILYTTEVKCKSGDFLLITCFGPGLVRSIVDAVEKPGEAWKSVEQFRRVGKQWKQEAFEVSKAAGIELIPWKDLDALKALAKCRRAIILDGKLRAQ